MEVRYTGFSGAIDLMIGPSRTLARLSAFAYGTFAVLAWLWVDNRWLAPGLSAAGMILGARSVYRYLCPLCSRLRVSSRGEWQLELDRWRSAELVAAPLILPALTVLRFRVDGARDTVRVLMAPDNAAADAFRRLRVRLRYR